MRASFIPRRLMPEWLQSKNLRLLVSSRTTMSIARSMTGVIVPIYLAQLGYSAIDIALLFIVTAVSSGILTAMVGLLADRFGRKPFLIIFPLLTAVAGAVYMVTRNFDLILLFAAVGSLGRGTGAGGGWARSSAGCWQGSRTLPPALASEAWTPTGRRSWSW